MYKIFPTYFSLVLCASTFERLKMTTSHEAQPPTYRPLQHEDSFRLLRFRRSPSGDPRDLSLVEYRLPSGACGADTPRFLALSYVWEGFSITTALAHIIYETTESEILYLWIDRICINQSDDNEKSHQVSMIWRIFACAERVIGWLGPAFEGCDEAFDDLLMISTADNASTDQCGHIIRRRFGDDIDAMLTYISSVMLHGSDLRIRMIRLFSLPWFGRRWIAQEACLNRNLRICCGRRSVSGEQLFQAIDRIHGIVMEGAASWLHKPFRNALAILQTRHVVRKAAKDSSCLSLPRIVSDLSFLECEHDVDRLNALFGIVGSSAPWFSPEYGTPAPKLFMKFALGHIQHFRSLKILHFAGIIDAVRHQMGVSEENSPFEISWPSEDLPSWVPDWRIPYRPLPIISTGNECPDHTIASAPFQLRSNWSKTTLALTAKFLKTSLQPCGLPYIDSYDPKATRPNQNSIDIWCNQMFIRYLGCLHEGLVTSYSCSPSFNYWFESLINTGLDRNLLKNIVRRFARTLIMDSRVRSTEKQDAKVPRDQIFEYFYEYAKSALFVDTSAAGDDHATMADRTHSMEKAAAYGYLAEHVCRYRTLFLCHDGRLGLGSAGISLSDRICFFPSLHTPFVLHQKGNNFLLGGECYLDGLMDIAYEDLLEEEVDIVLE